jgi:hypothetical protein
MRGRLHFEGTWATTAGRILLLKQSGLLYVLCVSRDVQQASVLQQQQLLNRSSWSPMQQPARSRAKTQKKPHTIAIGITRITTHRQHSTCHKD